MALGYSLFAGAQFPWMMLLGRFLHGVGLGFSTTISTIYIMEVMNMNGTLWSYRSYSVESNVLLPKFSEVDEIEYHSQK